MSERQRADFVGSGIGITNLVNRATTRASELTAEELRTGGRRLHDLSEKLRPKVTAVAGVTVYRQAFGRPEAHPGRQVETIGGGELWVVPNPSGLNAHETVESLSEWYRRVASAAGVI